MPAGTQPPSGRLARAVSAEVRAALGRHRMSVSALSRVTGISQSYLSRRMRDEAPLTLNDIESICAALGENVGRFLAVAATDLDEDF